MPQRLPALSAAIQFTRQTYTTNGQTITIWKGPSDCTGGYGLTSGLDSLLWFTLYGVPCNSGYIVSMTTAGAAVARSLPDALKDPNAITESADGSHMWFDTENGVDRLGSVTATGIVAPFAVPGTPKTSGIVAGPDKRLWFGLSSNLIAAANESGVVTLYKLPSSNDTVAAVAVGVDNDIWYSNSGSNGSKYGVGKITTSGISTDYVTGFATNDVTQGADGAIWFTVKGQPKVGHISENGTELTTYANGISGLPNQLVTGSDGNEYFDESVPSTGAAGIARVTLAGVVTQFLLPQGFVPSAITSGPDNDIWVLDADHDQLAQLSVPKSVFGSNLIVNPGADAGPGASNSSAIDIPPGWSVTGTMTAIEYGASGGFPLSTSPGPPNRGSNFFAGGPSAPTSTALQKINVASGSLPIDSGAVTFSLSAFLGGYADQEDRATVTLGFLAQSGKVLGSVVIGPVTAEDRNDVTGLIARGTTGKVPVGTRTLAVEITATRYGGSYNDGYADALALVLNLP